MTDDTAPPGPLARGEAGMTFGVLLPHFGPQASRTRILDGARLVERLGFDAVWVRDHLLWRPHSHEVQGDVTFVEPIVTLAAVGAVTERLYLGTSVLIPVRSPLKLAQELAALSFLTEGRVIAGVGGGHEKAELLAGGVAPGRRREAVVDEITILRRMWTEDHVTHEGGVFSVLDATLRPRPVAPIPIWFGGPSRHAVALAVDHCDGWLAGTIPFDTLDDRLVHLHELEAAAGKRLRLGAVPRLLIDRDRATARSRVNIAPLVEDGRHHWITPKSGTWSTLEDLRGALIAGEPMDVVEHVLDYAARGFDHYVFDVRWQFDRFDECLELIAERVLPELGAATAGRSPDGS
jgi:alkanesulfonate monooxygenase SsuD/methylene tetrahydromethanopterin reductase-like flavin-dependent oxidoreductase (luciferase family)